MHSAWLWCLVAAVGWKTGSVGAVVGGDEAAPPEPDAAVVFVQKHGRSARVEGVKNDRFSYFTFYGIRYAEPPVGVRRFQRPVRRYLAGELTANTPCASCPQPGANLLQVIGHEDCLCLNVFAPKMPGNEQGSPVVVFIHGGNYKTGSASPYGGKHLTQEDTLLVVPQYRLGSLGYITNGQKEASGNAGLYDLLVAMTWVKDYIEFFGGDPTRVVVMGQGSGGSTASLMALSTEGRTATGVAALSGTALSPGAVRSNPEDHSKLLANRTNCPPEPVERFILCLRKLPFEKIIEADSGADANIDTDKFLNEISGRAGTGARVEGEYDNRGLPTLVDEQPGDVLKKKKQRIPLFTGVTSAETRRVVFGKYSDFLKKQLRGVSNFIKKEIIGRLQRSVETINTLFPVQKSASEAVSQLQPVVALTEYYHQVLDNSIAAVEGLTKIVEATGDALFNFPAYQSVRAWSLGAPSYLYSFEFEGNLTKGSHFLPGVALADNGAVSSEAKDSTIKGPAHGDELAYIFDPLDEEGNSIEKDEISSTDHRVRKAFTGMIAKFARDLNPMGKKNGSKWSDYLYSKDNDQFLRINDKISLDKNFRFCQMGLWGNMGERLTGSLCKALFESLLNPLKLLQPISGNQTNLANILMPPTVNQLNKNGGNNAYHGVVPGLLNLNKKPESGQVTPTKPTANVVIPGLFGATNKKDTKKTEEEDKNDGSEVLIPGMMNINNKKSPSVQQVTRTSNRPSAVNVGSPLGLFGKL